MKIKQKIQNIYNKNIKIHMPFFLTDDILLCSLGFESLMFDKNYYWKIGYIDSSSEEDFTLINTGLLDKSINCSPHGFISNNKIYISFISDLNDFHYKLYSMDGYEITKLKNLQEIGRTGTGILTKENIFYTKPESINSCNLYMNNKIIAQFKNMHILRINSSIDKLTFCIDHDKYGLIEILISNDKNIKVIKLKNNDNSPYKCHLYKDVLIYTVKGDSFEDRVLNITKDYYLIDIPENIKEDIEIVNDWPSYI